MGRIFSMRGDWYSGRVLIFGINSMKDTARRYFSSILKDVAKFNFMTKIVWKYVVFSPCNSIMRRSNCSAPIHPSLFCCCPGVLITLFLSCPGLINPFNYFIFQYPALFSPHFFSAPPFFITHIFHWPLGCPGGGWGQNNLTHTLAESGYKSVDHTKLVRYS